jgi:hypothetical protein
MILDNTDPSGLGLFSKCARNQASKNKTVRPVTANSKKTKINVEESSRKRIVSHSWFDKQ